MSDEWRSTFIPIYKNKGDIRTRLVEAPTKECRSDGGVAQSREPGGDQYKLQAKPLRMI